MRRALDNTHSRTFLRCLLCIRMHLTGCEMRKQQEADPRNRSTRFSLLHLLVLFQVRLHEQLKSEAYLVGTQSPLILLLLLLLLHLLLRARCLCWARALSGSANLRDSVLRLPTDIHSWSSATHALWSEWSYHSPTDAQGHVCVCVCVCVCVYVCMYRSMCVCIYIYDGREIRDGGGGGMHEAGERGQGAGYYY